MLEVRLDRITKSYTPGQPVLRPFELTIAPGERFFLLGPSGCGKSTLLRIIAGLLEPDSGHIYFDGREVTHLAPEARRAPMVFQNYALWPNMSVRENVAFGLRAARKYDSQQIKQRTAEALATVQMSDYADRKPGALSGGQQQRVALARCLALEPGVLLLDEPLSNLDARLRDEMRLELGRLCRERGLTAIYVTHDRREALSLADRAAVLHQGVLQQVANPVDLYRRPANCFVAGFLGEANLLEADYLGNHTVRALGTEFTVAEVSPTLAAGAKARLFFRPEAVRFGVGEVNTFSARLLAGQFMGESFHWEFADGVRVTEAAGPEHEIGAVHSLHIAPEQLRILEE